MHAEPVAADTTTAEDAIVHLMMAISRRFRARLDGDAVDSSQASLLYALRCHGAMRLGDLAETMRLDASTVSRHVQQLGDRGYVIRDLDPQDGRARIVALSDAGAQSLRTLFDQRRAFLAESLESWGQADRDDLRRHLAHLAESLEEL